MSNLTITVDGQPHDIDAKPITLIVHQADERIEVPGSVAIGPMETMTRAANVSPELWRALKAEPRFMRLFRLVFPDHLGIDLPDNQTLQQHGSGVRHVVGLILLTLEAIADGKQPYWQLPESHLHPSAQAGLADLIVALTIKGE